METGPPDIVQAGRYGTRLGRRWWMVLALAAAIGLALAVGAPVLGRKTYVATTRVEVSPIGVDTASAAGGGSAAEVNLATEAELVTALSVATLAKALLKAPEEPRELAAHVTVAAPASAFELAISYRAPTLQDAQRGAGAFAKAYLDNRHAVGTAKLKARIAALRAQLAAARKRLQEVTAKRASLPENSPERTAAAAQEQMLINQISWLSAHLSPLEVTAIDPGRIISGPTLPAGD